MRAVALFAVALLFVGAWEWVIRERPRRANSDDARALARRHLKRRPPR